jgi:hypothetical protein
MAEALGGLRQRVQEIQRVGDLRHGFPIGMAPQGSVRGLLHISHRPDGVTPTRKVDGQHCRMLPGALAVARFLPRADPLM